MTRRVRNHWYGQVQPAYEEGVHAHFLEELPDSRFENHLLSCARVHRMIRPFGVKVHVLNVPEIYSLCELLGYTKRNSPQNLASGWGVVAVGDRTLR
jgi:hypothetical protein